MRGEFLDTVVDTVRSGGVAVQGSRVGEIQIVGITPEGDASLARIEFPYYGVEPAVKRGYRMTGVMRRGKIFRHFTEVSPVDVRVRDKVVLENEEGQKIKTTTVKSIFRYPAGETSLS